MKRIHYLLYILRVCILFSVYEDVPKALESWTNEGRKIYVYSSGSVEAQKLLFGHSVHGDLLKVFYDTIQYAIIKNIDVLTR